MSLGSNRSSASGGSTTWGDRVAAQLRGIAAWHDEAPAGRPGQSREDRLDLQRVVQARERERAALLVHLDRQERAVLAGPSSSRRPVIVIAHRRPWWRDKVRGALEDAGLCVDFVVEDGADAVAVLLAEQPEVVLAEDRLPTASGLDLVRRARLLSPATFIALQVPDEQALQAALDAGVRAAYTRQVPPADVAHDVHARLAGAHQRASDSRDS